MGIFMGAALFSSGFSPMAYTSLAIYLSAGSSALRERYHSSTLATTASTADMRAPARSGVRATHPSGKGPVRVCRGWWTSCRPAMTGWWFRGSSTPLLATMPPLAFLLPFPPAYRGEMGPGDRRGMDKARLTPSSSFATVSYAYSETTTNSCTLSPALPAPLLPFPLPLRSVLSSLLALLLLLMLMPSSDRSTSPPTAWSVTAVNQYLKLGTVPPDLERWTHCLLWRALGSVGLRAERTPVACVEGAVPARVLGSTSMPSVHVSPRYSEAWTSVSWATVRLDVNLPALRCAPHSASSHARPPSHDAHFRHRLEDPHEPVGVLPFVASLSPWPASIGRAVRTRLLRSALSALVDGDEDGGAGLYVSFQRRRAHQCRYPYATSFEAPGCASRTPLIPLGSGQDNKSLGASYFLLCCWLMYVGAAVRRTAVSAERVDEKKNQARVRDSFARSSVPPLHPVCSATPTARLAIRFLGSMTACMFSATLMQTHTCAPEGQRQNDEASGCFLSPSPWSHLRRILGAGGAARAESAEVPQTTSCFSSAPFSMHYPFSAAAS
ncbi:hypothetical protein FB451DRAFT_1446723 [Mycena latifolia]|nr:hypothetical protein FB451DRAFT_1446723 [Mycena latifolia]